MTVALATCSALPGLALDDRRLLAALRALGVATEPAVWEDPLYDWSAARLCVIRSAWDYAYRREVFVAWSRRIGVVTELWNPAPIVEWNTHKHYLVDLAAAGVPAVPTVVLPAGSSARLPDLVARQPWPSGDVILKAAVAQTGRHLLRVGPADRARGQAHLDRLLPHEDLLLQPFLPAVTDAGEVSLVFIDGAFSHAVRKRPAAGDFRVHDDYGGSIEPVGPTPEERQVAEAAMAVAGAPLLYGRVDLVPGPTGPVVMELELVEPDLFLGYAPGAAERLARAIAGRVG
jgi:glutathione synthase/RimK-type ligase-like ATP-grasp enzyme